MAMIRPETDMKDSGVQWLGNIPKEWRVGKVKHEFYATKTIVGDKVNDYERLALTLNGVIKRSKDAGDGLQPEKFDGYQILKEHELVFKLIDLANVSTSRVGLSPYTGIVSPAYIVLHHRKDMNPRYGEYYFLSMWMNEVFNHIGGDGVRSALNAKDLLNIPYLKVSSDEQQAIADYLDETCSKIDEIIAEAKASIDEYKGLKQSVIFEAVTKGLDKNVEMKAVNLEYLDSCPMDWNILPVSILFDFFGGFAYKSDRFCEETNNQVVRLGNVKDDELRLNSNPVYVSDEYADDSSKAAIKVDDILFTMTGTRGKGDYFYTLIITEDDLKEKNLFLNQRVGCFRKAYHTVYMPYYNYLLKSPKIRERVFLYETGTANQGNIGIENINRIRLYNPPMEVQKNIVRMLNQKCNIINSLITEKESLINDLEAYKKSLIYEVVTGKRRVV